VQLAADGPCDRRDAPLDRHVDVLVLGLERERAGGQLGLDGVERRQQRVALLGAEDRLRREHPRMGARALDVVGPQPLVEGQRRVQAPEDRVLGLGEARHPRRAYGNDRRRACATVRNAAGSLPRAARR
jgi:hypothetical protein